MANKNIERELKEIDRGIFAPDDSSEIERLAEVCLKDAVLRDIMKYAATSEYRELVRQENFRIRDRNEWRDINPRRSGVEDELYVTSSSH